MNESVRRDAGEAIDPIALELYRHRFAGVAEEMGVTLRRTSFSPNIKERLDFSCALFDGAGRMVAQAAHIPVHLGAMPASVAAALARFERWQQGDVVIVNDPFEGGNHLPDITMIAPVFLAAAGSAESDEGPAFFVASRAHHADVGGISPGSLPLSTEIYQEGIIIPPVKLYEAGEANEALLQVILRNVRTPEERRGDLAAQRAAAAVGARRLGELAARHGRDELTAYAEHLMDYSERLARADIGRWPAGVYRFTDVVELVANDAANGAGPAAVTLVPICVTATIGGGEIAFDFSGTAEGVAGSLNAVLAIAESACYYVVRCLMDADPPVNDGCFRPVRVTAPAGCLVNARPPAAVAAGNVETSQRITDAVLGALAQALPGRIPAASQGTMNNLLVGGQRADGSPYTYYETIGGGMGGGPALAGLSGVQVHMTNTLNTPVEALEMAYPFRLARYGLRAGSGGAGRHAGGDGIMREYEFLGAAVVTLISERRTAQPWGLAGGQPGAPGRALLLRAGGGEEELPAKCTVQVGPGDRLRIETPGGGGWGEALSAG